MSRDGTGAPSIRQSKAKKARQKVDDRLCLARCDFLSAGSDDCPYGIRVLYIKEHLAHTPDSKLPDGNIGDSTGNTIVVGSLCCFTRNGNSLRFN